MHLNFKEINMSSPTDGDVDNSNELQLKTNKINYVSQANFTEKLLFSLGNVGSTKAYHSEID